ncbi:MAG: RHS repeat-associated core domain-containing protein [Leifsonia sp.]
MRRSWTRSAVTSLALGALVATGTVTPAEAAPWEIARRTSAATLAEVRAAAADREVREKEETTAPPPVTEGTVRPGATSKVAAESLGVTATFSGHTVDDQLTVTVGEAPRTAEVSARAEQPGGGVPVSDPVEITAVDGAGKERTSFPAKRVDTRGGGGKGPVVSDVVPGLALALKPDAKAVKAADVDLATLRIYTREGAGDPWVQLPSYYDMKTGLVKGESTHLSQFVVIGTKFVPPSGPVVVLDPDNDDGRVTTPAPPVSELGYNIRLAQLVRGILQQDCRASVQLTREDPAVPFVSRTTRAGIAASFNPVATVGLAFNTLDGESWGGVDASLGGSQVYSRGGGADDALSNALVGNLPTYTTRPARNLGNNGTFPGSEFDGVPGALTHLEALFLDNNLDRAIIDDPAGFQHIANGVLVGLGTWLETQGFDCTDPVTGGWPAPPSAADIARWRLLGLQNYLTYGGEPFSFSTGNLVEQEKLFSLPGLGGSTTDLTLFYNSQDGRLSRVGAGWSFGLGARAQRFDDGSVMVVRGDGASFAFNPDGVGGYRTEPGLHQTLTEQPGGRLQLTDVSGESWVFDAGDIEGIGELVSHTDANGSTTTLSYGPADPGVQQFVPLTSITVPGGQVIQVQSDAEGRVTGFTRPGGDRWSLEYDAAGDLRTITLPDGRTHRFAYDGSHQLLTATDATGTLYLKNEYDGAGRIVKQWDAAGKLRTLDYSKAGQTTYTDTLGRRSVYFYDSAFRVTKVQHPDGTTASFAFDGQNNVTTATDENAHTTRYAYDNSGNIVTATTPSGQVIKYTYTPTGRLATKTDAGGAKGAARTWAYDYDAAGRLTTVHQPDGSALKRRYDAAGNLVASVQPSGATTSYGYDAMGNITTVTDATGAVTRYAYDAAGRITSVTDANGRTTAYSWDSGDRVTAVIDPAGGVTVYGYEPNDHVSSVTDPAGGRSAFVWDALFHLTQTTNPVGGVTAYTYDGEDSLIGAKGPLGDTTSYRTDGQDRVTEVTDPNGGTWKREYDGVGNVTRVTSPTGASTRYAYDASGNLLSQTDPTGAVTRYAYDGVGRPVAVTDADGVATRFAYDVMDRVTRVTDGAGKHTDYAYDADGNVVTVTDRKGDTTVYAYDAAGQLLSSTTPTGSTTSYSYDSVGNVVATTDPLGRSTTIAYTPTDQVASVTDAAGNTTSYGYDGAGRRTSVTDANGHTTRYAYDPAGRQTGLTDPTGATTAYGYDVGGRQTSLTAPGGSITRYEYDPAGQLTQVVEGYKKGAKPGPAVNVSTRYAYDPDGNLLTVSDPNGHTTRYTVDAAGRTTSETNPVGNTSRRTYTAAGRESSVVTGTGATTSFRYDKRGDLVRQDAAGAIATFEYDSEQNLIAVTDPGGVTGFQYDADGRITVQLDQQGGRLKTAYDKAGQTASVTLPTGQKLSYTYDRAGRATSQSSPWGDLAYAWDAVGNLTRLDRSTGVGSAYAYDAADRVTAITHTTPQPSAQAVPVATPTPAPYAKGSAAATACTGVSGYLGARAASTTTAPLCEKSAEYVKVRTLPAEGNPVPDGGVLSYRYAYDADGNVTSATRRIASTPDTLGSSALPTTPVPPTSVTTSSTSYAYDPLGRLTSSKTTAGEKNTYGYDAAGNRTSWSRSGAKDGDFSQRASFNDANQLTGSETSGRGRGVSAGTASYSYDAAGNRVNQTVAGVSTRFAYNPAGQTTEVAREGRTTSYGYDGLGRNTSVTDQTRYGTSTTRTVFDGLQPAQQSAQSTGTTTLIRDVLGSLAEHVTQDGTATWDLLDRLGSTVAGAAGGSITQLSSYEDWGAQRFETGGWSAGENFTGESTDPTEGLNHYYARTYDPAAAVWTSADPWRGLLTQPQSLHRYAYVENDPATSFDELGFKAKQQRMKLPPALPKCEPLLQKCGGSPLPIAGTGPTNMCISDPRPPCSSQYLPASPQPSRGPGSPDRPKATGPNSKSDVTDSHGCKPGTLWQSNAYTNGQCVSKEALQQQQKDWENFFDVLGWIGAAAGIASLIPGLQWLAPIAVVASAASTIYNCVVGGSKLVSCAVGVVVTVIPAGGQVAAKLLRQKVEGWVTDAITQASKALGISGNALGLAQGW